MPYKEFLETYPLYKKCLIESRGMFVSDIPEVSLNMHCPDCDSNQTFVPHGRPTNGTGQTNAEVHESIIHFDYLCGHCQYFQRKFFVFHDLSDPPQMMKIGQHPAWEIKVDKQFAKALRSDVGLFKKGLICESQGYGIGAFSYYRRIVETSIDELLEKVEPLLPEEDKPVYLEALAKVKTTRVTADKIALVKDLLPEILMPSGMNPLGVLHSSLSEGLHALDDDKCLEKAASIRKVMKFLVQQLEVTNTAAQEFTDGMRTLLDKKVK